MAELVLWSTGTTALPDHTRRSAAVAIAANAKDDKDCLELLRMLGLAEPPRRASRGRAGVPSPDYGNPTSGRRCNG